MPCKACTAFRYDHEVIDMGYCTIDTDGLVTENSPIVKDCALSCGRKRDFVNTTVIYR